MKKVVWIIAIVVFSMGAYSCSERTTAEEDAENLVQEAPTIYATEKGETSSGGDKD